jgi:hypothetical protein
MSFAATVMWADELQKKNSVAGELREKIGKKVT